VPVWAGSPLTPADQYPARSPLRSAPPRLHGICCSGARFYLFRATRIREKCPQKQFDRGSWVRFKRSRTQTHYMSGFGSEIFFRRPARGPGPVRGGFSVTQCARSCHIGDGHEREAAKPFASGTKSRRSWPGAGGGGAGGGGAGRRWRGRRWRGRRWRRLRWRRRRRRRWQLAPIGLALIFLESKRYRRNSPGHGCSRYCACVFLAKTSTLGDDRAGAGPSGILL
jgi:hypothetical protein